jgi:hypothetical protein
MTHKKKITDEIASEIIELCKSGEYGERYPFSWTKLAETLNRNHPGLNIARETIRKSKLITIGLETGNIPVNQIIEKTPGDYKLIEDENRRLQKRLNKGFDWVGNIMRIVEQQIPKMGIKALPKQFYVTNKKSGKKQKHNMSFDCLISDTHYGSYIRPQDTLGIGNYSPEIYHKRMQTWEEKIYLLKEEDASNHGLDNATLWFAGDLVEGSGVYVGQHWNLAQTELEQIFNAADDWFNRILRLQTAFEKITAYYVTGNHGMKSNRRDPFHSSWTADLLIGYIVQRLLQKVDGIDFYVSDSPKMLVRRGDFNFCISHGDDAQSWNGIPYYGIDRIVKKIPDLTGIIIDYFLRAHNHTSGILDGGKVINNGCVVGGSDLSINKMNVNSGAMQWAWYFHQKHGINRMTELHLDRKPKLEFNENNIATPYNNLAFKE